MARLEELATAAKSTMLKDQVHVLIENEVDNDLKFKNKFIELCLEVTATVKEMEDVIEGLERFPGNLIDVKIVRVVKRVQQRGLENETRLKITAANPILVWVRSSSSLRR
uniref:Uncharacterized protein n=1 Tax=Tanacetum cinerariifolium TaxID=118510 RepID=A0A6L2NJD9_TANCI|nr:hypothetical protein [Tanacetum cinerariifolium]